MPCACHPLHVGRQMAMSLRQADGGTVAMMLISRRWRGPWQKISRRAEQPTGKMPPTAQMTCRAVVCGQAQPCTHLEPVHVGQAPRGGAQRAAGPHEAAAVPGASNLRRLAQAGDGDRHHGALVDGVRSQQAPRLLRTS